MQQITVREALASQEPREHVLVYGWVRTRRESKTFSFLEINDGSCQKNLQVVIESNLPQYAELVHIHTGASVRIEGRLVRSEGVGQVWEIAATAFQLVGAAEASYPLQKKGHTLEFLREIAHLRPRSNLFGAVFRVRSRLAYAIHQFFQERGFYYVHTPIITASDCEGAGEMFRVTTLDLAKPPRLPEGGIDFSRDFFKKASYLTVSGQLEAEIMACALGKVYTFGPTFRAENSHTSRHASEFWMIEPEVAFCDLAGNMDLAESFIKYLIQDILAQCPEEMEFLGKFVDRGLRQRLEFVLERPFIRVTYAEAIELLLHCGKTFEFPVQYGANLQSEHERFLTEVHFQQPTTVYNYPRAIKPFYMRVNDERETVAAMDVLVPGIGEIIGGSQREERWEVLLDNLKQHGLSEKDYWWYLDLRRYGTVPHAGFGLGFERMLMFITGVGNIRDVIPFPRTPGVCEF